MRHDFVRVCSALSDITQYLRRAKGSASKRKKWFPEEELQVDLSLIDTLTQRTEQMELDIIELEQGLMEVYKDNKAKDIQGIMELAAKNKEEGDCNAR